MLYGKALRVCYRSWRAGWELARSMIEVPPVRGITAVHQVAADSKDFGPAVAAALADRAEAVVFAGTSPHRAALCARAPATAGFKRARVSVGAVLEPAFLSQAGQAADSWAFSTPFTDALLFVAEGMRALGKGGAERGAMVHRLREIPYRGPAKTIEFDRRVFTLKAGTGLFIHRVEDGRPRFLGAFNKIRG